MALTSIFLSQGGCVFYKGKATRPRLVHEIEANTPADTVEPAKPGDSSLPPPGSLEPKEQGEAGDENGGE